MGAAPVRTIHIAGIEGETLAPVPCTESWKAARVVSSIAWEA